jgi:hypothetical protein
MGMLRLIYLNFVDEALTIADLNIRLIQTHHGQKKNLAGWSTSWI